MRSSIIAGIIALAASTVTAQSYTNQSAPFFLVLSSRNKTLDGQALASCHEGAAIEGLCLNGPLNTSTTYNTYNLNMSDYQSNPTLGTQGVLVWELHGGNFNLSSPLSLNPGLISNVAVPLFTPSDADQATQFGFDAEDNLYVPGGLDDTVVPPVYNSKAYQRWYVCKTNVGYYYDTLSWVVGTHSPENPTCEKVTVKRVFV